MPVPESSAHPGFLRKLVLRWSWLVGQAVAGLDSHEKGCACVCVSVCSQPVATQPPFRVGPSAGSASPATDHLGRPT